MDFGHQWAGGIKDNQLTVFGFLLDFFETP
jgi:hypothetical protein